MPEVNELAQQRDREQFKALNENPKLHEIAEQLDLEYYQRWAEEQDSEQRERIWNRASGIREVLALIRHMSKDPADEPDPEVAA